MSKEFDEFCSPIRRQFNPCYGRCSNCESAFLAGQESIENNITRIKKDLVETEQFYEKKMGELKKENKELREQLFRVEECLIHWADFKNANDEVRKIFYKHRRKEGGE